MSDISEVTAAGLAAGLAVVPDGGQIIPAAPLEIIVAQRGWVVIGRKVSESDTEIVLHDASVIRVWGTTKGLGQLALEGQQSGTKLDPAGTIRIHPLAVVLRMDTEAALWA